MGVRKIGGRFLRLFQLEREPSSNSNIGLKRGRSKKDREVSEDCLQHLPF